MRRDSTICNPTNTQTMAEYPSALAYKLIRGNSMMIGMLAAMPLTLILPTAHSSVSR